MARKHLHRVRIDREARQLEVALDLEREAHGDLELAVPTWVPGAYAFMKYARDVFDVRAEDAKSGERLRVRREGWSRFVVENAPAHVTVHARVTASDPAWGELVGIVTHDAAIIHATHFLFDPSHRGPCAIAIEAPAGWNVHHPGGGKALGDRAWEHPTFAALMDTPIVAGHFTLDTRVEGGTTFHHLFLDKAVGFDREARVFVDQVMTITRGARDVFGAFPTPSYTFVYSCDPRAHWGLEHANATLMAIGEGVFIDAEERASAMRLAAHELFHAWNVCRLKPKALVSVDLVNGSFPDGLWISEGFTRYYELLLATRAGALTPQRFLSNMVRYDDALRVLPAIKHTSLADSSYATFLNHNRYPGSSSATIDYYDKGMVVAFALDAALRSAARPSSLDAAMAAFYKEFVESGFSTADAITFFDRFAAPFGPHEPVGALLERTVVGAAMPDVAGSLERLGVRVTRGTKPHVGLWLLRDRGPEITDVAAGSPAAAAGLGATEEVVAVDGFAFRADALRYLVSSGEPFTMTVKSGQGFRDARIAPAPRDAVLGLSLPDGGAPLAEWLGPAAKDLVPGCNVPLSHYDNFHSRESML